MLKDIFTLAVFAKVNRVVRIAILEYLRSDGVIVYDTCVATLAYIYRAVKKISL